MYVRARVCIVTNICYHLLLFVILLPIKYRSLYWTGGSGVYDGETAEVMTETNWVREKKKVEEKEGWGQGEREEERTLRGEGG